MRKSLFLLMTIAFIILAAGCSGSGGPIEPVADVSVAAASDSHQLWGLWQFVADPAAQSLDVVELRTGEMHLNAIPFLEPPALVYLTLETLQFNGNIIEADIGLRHPFLGLNEFTGFDVCGILVSNGSVSGFDDPGLLMAGEGDTRLLNADGYTRWWNPAEFPVNEGTIFSYNDGLLGAPDSFADYNCTLNGYKLFCDDLDDPDAPVGDVDVTSRCIFSAGQKNVRHYSIEIGDNGLVFNYAIDANWQFPQGNPPWDIPDDFGPAANRVEAWNVEITELENTLWNDGDDYGGDLSLSIDVWDHFDVNLNTVKVESGDNFDVASSGTATGGGEGYSTYEIDIVDATPAPDTIDILITVESEAGDYQGMLGGETISAYFTYSTTVDDEPVGPVECGTEIHSSLTQTPLTDGGNYNRNEIPALVSGPYAGQTLAQTSSGVISRYDMSSFAAHTGNAFITLPAGTYSGIIYHIDVEPVTGRVIVVPDGLGNNNSMLIFDNTGSLISSSSGISVGAGRKIYGVTPNENGDLWLLTTGNSSFSTSYDSRIEKWVYQSGSPYYTYDASFNLDTDSIIGEYYSYGWRVNNDITEICLVWDVQRLFILQQAQIGEHNGKLYIFDINESTPPTYRSDLSDMSLFSQGTWRSFYDNQRGSNGGLVCDHSDIPYDRCRVIAFGRSHPDMDPMIVRLDGDGVVLNEAIFPAYPSVSTCGITNYVPASPNTLIMVDYMPANCYMLPAPSDW